MCAELDGAVATREPRETAEESPAAKEGLGERPSIEPIILEESSVSLAAVPDSAGVTFAAASWDVPTSSDEEPMPRAAASTSSAIVAKGKPSTPLREGVSAWDALTSSDAGSEAEEVREAAVVTPAVDSLPTPASAVTATPAPAVVPHVTASPRVHLGLEPWMKPVLGMSEQLRSNVGVFTRDVFIVPFNFCAGSECMALEMLGVPYRVLATSAGKGSSRDWCHRLFRDRVDCCFTTSGELASDTGWDRFNGGRLTTTNNRRSDCSTARLPMSSTKIKCGISVDGEQSATSTYEVVIKDWFDHLRKNQPSSFCVEFDPQMKTVVNGYGVCPFDEWMSTARSLGYAIVHFTVPFDLWVAGVPWSSLVVAGFSKDCGGPRAATWFRTVVQPFLLLQKASGPACQIWRRPQAKGGPPSLPGVLDIDPEGRFDSEADSSDVVISFII